MMPVRRLTLLTNPDRCNLACPLCFLHQRSKAFDMGEMPFDVARAAVERYSQLRDLDGNLVLEEVIPSTMGEPLLYSKFRELLGLCLSLSIPLNLTTNGTFPLGWGDESNMQLLLRSCRDIKISCMGFDSCTVDEMMGGALFNQWKANVEKLVCVRKNCCENVIFRDCGVSTVSLQVTLHKKNVEQARNILMWAESIGIARVKWNVAYFLERASDDLKKRYALDDETIAVLREELHSDKVLCEGSLFFNDQECVDVSNLECPFRDEIWVYPDGSEDHCPHPEHRFGKGMKNLCKSCFMKRVLIK
ncbi:MAG: radical SAM protein [Fibrobacter sp.]|nr:radical SAM protein [Fibrobacter sp.]